jgi:hypothetical protein
LPPVIKNGPTVPPRIQLLVRVVSGARLTRKIAEIAAMHPPSQAHDVGGARALPPKKRPQGSRASVLKCPPYSVPTCSSGLPPRAPPRTTSGLPRRAPVDPLLHYLVVTPPCPILPGEDETRVELRVYTHVSIKKILYMFTNYFCTSLAVFYALLFLT